ncbi:hypothetical protein GobsT_01030 [Gemmata obscuriglobus]|nr:hypothetical protein GobsT_01030 [Gemmata obscuriglobus]VTR98396.1 unnamed protein product [Gemmata obscuriglobus UQM 2246]
MAKFSAGERKRRTRQHVIADLSANHVERRDMSCTEYRPITDTTW